MQALLIYRLVVGAMAANGFSVAVVGPTFLISILQLGGWSCSRVFVRYMDPIQHVPTAVILQFVSTFGVWILADRLGLSGVLTMVSFAVVLARSLPERIPARMRIPTYAVWETAVFVMNILAFIFIGLQVRPIVDSLAPADRGRYIAVAVLLTVLSFVSLG
jgi:NhaP-type Na+/H+ or K+/H+ antiporter